MTKKNLPALPAPVGNTRAISRQATSYVTAPTAEPDEDDPLLGFEPYLHKAPRKNSITPDRQRRFIAHLAATGIVTQAAKHIGASMEALYKLRSKPGAKGFAQAWELAIDRGMRRLEDCALQRAIEGEERLVVSSGKLIGTERRHNESLVMFLMRQRRADRYGSEIRPGHALYERIRREVLAETAPMQEDEDAVLASLKAKFDTMRKRQQQWLADQIRDGTLPDDICTSCGAQLPAPMMLAASSA